MHPKCYARRLLTWGLVLVAGMTAAVSSGQQPDPKQPAKQPAAEQVKVDKSGALIVPVGGQVSFDPKLDPKDTLVGFRVANDAILFAQPDPADPGKFLLTGRRPGLTQLILEIQGKPELAYDVVVQYDLNLLRKIIRQTVPTAAVDVQPGVGEVVILSGYVTSPQDADIVGRLASSVVENPQNVINAVQVGGGQQVQIDVVIALVNRSLARDRGFDFVIQGGSAQFGSIVSGLIGNPVGGAASVTGGNMVLQAGTVPDQFFGALQALRVEGVTKFLAEPRIVTQSGRVANFRVGGQQAVISGTSGITGPGVALVPFGTELSVAPIVYGNGMIWLEINPRVTTVNANLGITVGGAVSPGFNEQTVQTAVMLRSGQTYAIGGLIQNSVTASANKIPVLGQIPYLGTLFSRTQHQQTETELVILVTPRLVSPMNCDQTPRRLPGQETRNPDDYELFLELILEAPRGQRKVWNGRCYNAPWKCSPTARIFPCVGNVCTGGASGCGANGGCAGYGAMPTTGGMYAPTPGMYPAPGPVPSGAHAVPPVGDLPAIPSELPAIPPAPPAPAVPGSAVQGAAEPGQLNLQSTPPPVVTVPVPEGY